MMESCFLPLVEGLSKYEYQACIPTDDVLDMYCTSQVYREVHKPFSHSCVFSVASF